MPDTPLNPDALEVAVRAFEKNANAYMQALYTSDEVIEDAITAYLAAAQPEVNSVEELDQLPAGSYVQGWDGFKHAKDWNGGWHLIVNRPSSAPHLSGSIELPARVLYRPEVES